VADALGHLDGIDYEPARRVTEDVACDCAQLVTAPPLLEDDAPQVDIARPRKTEALRSSTYAATSLRQRDGPIIEPAHGG
jgi:hypothetical protein